MTTIVDVARASGVTPSVVSRLLNGDPKLRIRPDTRDRILGAVDRLGYTANSAARALRKARTGTLGLLVHDISNPIYAQIIAGAQQSATAHGYTLLLGDTDALAAGPGALDTMLAGRRVDGLLMQRAGVASDEVVEQIAAARLPTVLLNDWTTGGLSAVALDDVAAARLATEYLSDLGHTKIAHLAGAPSHRARQRLVGYEQVVRERGLAAGAGLVGDGGWDVASGHAGMAALLAARPLPTAVFAANTLAAIGAMSAIAEAGLTIPGDLSLIAVHDVWFVEHLTPPMTTLDLPLRRMGRTAVDILLDAIAGAPAQHVLVKDPAVTVVPRASTAPPARPRRHR